jgi:uncharacterized protein (TIGR03435 family)
MVFAQSRDEAGTKFEIADIHPAAKVTGQLNQFMRTSPPRDGRYEIRNASMLDLVRLAYGFDPDKVLGGPSWLEMDRFDAIAKVPAGGGGTAVPAEGGLSDSLKEMLQSLLADRFSLKVHKDTKPLPTYVLTVGKKPLLKEADGSGDTGCKAQSDTSGSDGVTFFMNGTGIKLGPGNTIRYACRNMTMEAFAAGFRMMLGSPNMQNPVLDQTGLKGAWNFDIRWSFGLFMMNQQDPGDRITAFDALEKQLGLKLEERQIPTPVIVVDSVNEQPTPNPPGVAEALPDVPLPTEFDVADIKPTDPAAGMGGRFQMQPGGRLNAQGLPMQFFLMRAFNANSSDQLVGIPGWAQSERFDITAKAPASAGNLDMVSMAPLLLSLLKDRFKLAYHTEERPLTAYALVATKPKLKKADPASRTSCKNPPIPTAQQGEITMVCQNYTMAQFAERLRYMGPGLANGILDSTGLEGGWDFTLTYNQLAGMNLGGGRGGNAGQSESAAPMASDPSGGLSIFEAIEKQLGLKLETQKRPLPVVVIDHLEQKPTDN